MVEVKTKKKASSPKKTATKTAAPAAKKAISRKKPPAPEEIGKLRIKVSAYEHKLLDASVKQIAETALRYGGTINGPIPLPTEIRRWTVNRSSFIDKNSREQFEMRIHKRLIDIVNPGAKIIEALTNLDLASGVNIDLKML